MKFKKEIDAIQNNIHLWNKISEINRQYAQFDFNDINCPIVIASYKKRTTKAKYGEVWFGGSTIWNCTFDFYDFLVSKIFEEKHLYTDLVKQYRNLAEKYFEYKTKVDEVFKKYMLCKSPDDCMNDLRGFFNKYFGMTDLVRYQKLRDLETAVFDTKTFSPSFPTVKLELSAVTQYSSYSREITYDFEDIIRCYDLALEKEGKMSFVQKQRAIVSDSIRYDVFKRDSFCCRICGATAKDGAKLEVDHIIPVSKGGKSTLNNLQTLCERCNRGKGTKQ